MEIKVNIKEIILPTFSIKLKGNETIEEITKLISKIKEIEKWQLLKKVLLYSIRLLVFSRLVKSYSVQE